MNSWVSSWVTSTLDWLTLERGVDRTPLSHPSRLFLSQQVKDVQPSLPLSHFLGLQVIVHTCHMKFMNNVVNVNVVKNIIRTNSGMLISTSRDVRDFAFFKTVISWPCYIFGHCLS